MTESLLRNTPAEIDRQDLEKELKKSRDKYKRLYNKTLSEKDRAIVELRGMKQELTETKCRLARYEGIMQFIAEELSTKFGILLRKEAESDYVRY